jgi:divalent metal cation (Fe/Co/Zn/Cd) transporter
MAAAGIPLTPSEHAALARGVRLISWLTLAWLAADGGIGLAAGLMANSVALIGWGIDCAIEAAACLVVIWRFTGARAHSGDAERLAQRVVAVSFMLLAPYVVAGAASQLVTGNAATASWAGIGLAAADVMLMPLLGRAKKRFGHQLGSPATTSGGRQNILCAYLSLAVLAGLAANALAGLWWADPAVALAVALAAVLAGARTWRGNECS